MSDCKERTIALLTDFGLKGAHYVASMKAVIYKIKPTVKIIDISHSVAPFSIIEASYILKSTYSYFPEETIFIVVVDPGVGSDRKILILKTKDNYYFIGPDNGIFSLALNSNISHCFIAKNEEYFRKPISNTFHGRDIMGPLAAYISSGVPLKNLGPPLNFTDIIKSSLIYKINIDDKLIKCTIQYIDDFGNLVTNIKLKNNKIDNTNFHLKQNQKITISIDNKDYNCVYTSYFTAVPNNSLLIIKGSTGYLEISINQGNASNKLKITSGDIIIVKLD